MTGLFNKEMKLQYLTGQKKFVKKGKETNPFIGKIVKVDWRLKSKERYVAELTRRDRAWFNAQESFIVTDIRNWGLGSEVTLDGRLTMDAFVVYEPSTGEYVYKHAQKNGTGYYQDKPLLQKYTQEAKEAKDCYPDEQMEINWLESTDEWVVNRGTYIIADGVRSEYAAGQLLHYLEGELEND